MSIKNEKDNSERLFRASEKCTICLDYVDESQERSIARLRCGHHFHLDCIGTYFNTRGAIACRRGHAEDCISCSWSVAEGAMECPNCRDVEIRWWRLSDHSQQRSNLPAVQDYFSDGDDFCMDVIKNFQTRSIARLNCGHFFHLACAGSSFNAKRLVQCPNCMVTEQGQWFFRTRDNYYFAEDDSDSDHSIDESGGTTSGTYFDAGVHDESSDNSATNSSVPSSSNSRDESELAFFACMSTMTSCQIEAGLEGGDSDERLNDEVFHVRNPTWTSNWLLLNNDQGFFDFWTTWARFNFYRRHSFPPPRPPLNGA